MNRTYIDKVAKLLREIFLENDKLSIFMNGLTIGKITNQGQYYPNYSIRFPKDESKSNIEGISYTANEEFSAIRICDLSPKELNYRSIFGEDTDGYRRTSSIGENQFFYCNLFNNHWRQQMPSKKIGINVNKKAKIKGYILNFSDIRKLMAGLIQYDSVIDCIYEYYYVGDKNSLLAMSSINGILYIRAQALQKLLDENDKETIKKTLNNLFVCFHTMFEKFSDLNIAEFKKEFSEDIQSSLLNKIMVSNYYSRRFSSNINDKDPEIYISELKQYIKSQLDNFFSNGIFGIKDKYSYANIISRIITNRKEREKVIYREAYSKGMQTGLKMEMLGWKPCEINFPDDHKISLWWAKEVTIIPNTFMYQNVRYTIPEKERKWKIDTLYINQLGEMRCHGNHPNVSSSKVCMGDLQIDFTKDLSNIQEMLTRAVTLLDMINYDSAYDHSAQDHLVQVSTVCNVLDIKNSTKIKMGGVRELGSNFAGDEDDEEEIIDTAKSTVKKDTIQIKNSKKEVIAELIKHKPLDERSARSTDRLSAVTNDLEELTNQTPVYYVQDASVLQDITVVSNNGERRPMVFISGPVENQSISQHETLMLGDENILR